MITCEQFDKLTKNTQFHIKDLEQQVRDRDEMIAVLKQDFNIKDQIGTFSPHGRHKVGFEMPMTKYSHARFFERPLSIDVRYEGNEWLSIMGDQAIEIQPRAANSFWVKVRDYANRT